MRISKIRAKLRVVGESVRASTTKYVWETSVWPRIELGYGNNVEDSVIRSRVSKSVMPGYDADTEAAKLLKRDDGLSNQSVFKVRSIPLWKLRGIEIPIKHRINNYKNQKNIKLKNPIKMFYSSVKHFAIICNLNKTDINNIIRM